MNGQPQKSGIVDHNDVNIIDANDDFGEQEVDDMDDLGLLQDESDRNLNRQTDNMADFEKRQAANGQGQRRGTDSPNMIQDEMDEYDEEINVGDHSNVIINDHEDTEDLGQLKNQLQNLDAKQQIIDDQNLQMDSSQEGIEGDSQQQMSQQDDQHLEDLEEKLVKDYQMLQEIDPELLEAAE